MLPPHSTSPSCRLLVRVLDPDTDFIGVSSILAAADAHPPADSTCWALPSTDPVSDVSSSRQVKVFNHTGERGVREEERESMCAFSIILVLIPLSFFLSSCVSIHLPLYLPVSLSSSFLSPSLSLSLYLCLCLCLCLCLSLSLSLNQKRAAFACGIE